MDGRGPLFEGKVRTGAAAVTEGRRRKIGRRKIGCARGVKNSSLFCVKRRILVNKRIPVYGGFEEQRFRQLLTPERSHTTAMTAPVVNVMKPT